MTKRWKEVAKRWKEVTKRWQRDGKKGSKMTATIDWSQFMFIPGIVKVGGSKWVILVTL